MIFWLTLLRSAHGPLGVRYERLTQNVKFVTNQLYIASIVHMIEKSNSTSRHAIEPCARMIHEKHS